MLVLVYCFELFNLFVGHLGADTNYCNFKCGRNHTVCRRQPCHQNSKCGENYKMILPNDTVRQWMLDIHNEFRDHISANPGSVVSGSSGAKNMQILSYSKELEFVAQCWANNCNADGSHDDCRSTSRFDYVGQNVYGPKKTGMAWDINYDSVEIAIQAWFDEYEGTNMKDIDCFGCESSSNLHAISHFTQMVWAETTQVGCGVTKYGSGNEVNWLLVCNYGKGGNLPTLPVYKEGTPPCSECVNDGKCNAKYPTLCGESRSLAMDTWTPPFALGAEKISGSAMAVCLLVVVASSSAIFRL